jgi:putative DNA methylase
VSIEAFAWRVRPSLIERLLPAQKISAEAQKERKAGAGQTLTALGSYWKGRKPLILVKACVLGALLPVSDDAEADLAIFEKLMAIDDEAFLRRELRAGCLELVKRLHPRGEMSADDAERLFEVRVREVVEGKSVWVIKPFTIDSVESLGRGVLVWQKGVTESERHSWQLQWVRSLTYLERVALAKRPEELDQAELFKPVWDEVNKHLGTDAYSLPDLVEQLGILRFGHRPRVGDTFCGGGSIPFEAARLGCDVYASDLNPIACMLTWGALNIIGASEGQRRELEAAQADVAAALDREITALGIEHDCEGNRGKAYYYCAEVRCPQTGWMVPLCASWVISTAQNTIARLVPDPVQRRFNIEIVSGVSADELEQAGEGTFRDGDVVYALGGETYRTKFKTIRGDARLPDGRTSNKLRLWEKSDFVPRPDDIIQERLYCIQWIKRETLSKARQETFFASVTDEDVRREQKVEAIVRENLSIWQAEGLVPDMPIEPGDKTDEPIRTRGWTYWHHLFNPRQLLLLSRVRALAANASGVSAPPLQISFAHLANRQSKLCRLDVYNGKGREPKLSDTFTNQALNTLLNYGSRASLYMISLIEPFPVQSVAATSRDVRVAKASAPAWNCDLWITDPPYADAVRYEEITEYFIAWLRKNPPPPFDQWVWDSRRALAIQGTGEEFRRAMTSAYTATSANMPDNGVQIVMFTHQDASVWADMAAIVWGAGLQVAAAWYIATETSSELKKGGYVQGTVLLVLRKRLQDDSAYRDELVQEVRAEVARQIETMTGLNQLAKGAGRSENLFEDQDLQMAGYAAALRILTGYCRIDGQDMAAEALRPRQAGSSDIVKEVIDFAVQVANEYLVPEGIAPSLWERLSGSERFYLRMLNIEAGGAKKLDNYQNFAKAFRYGDYTAVMASVKPSDARLKTALELRKSEFESEFGKSPLRAVLFALYELQREVDIDEIISHLRDMVPGYLSRREDLMAMASAIAAKREFKAPAEAQAARILFSRIRNERLG